MNKPDELLKKRKNGKKLSSDEISILIRWYDFEVAKWYKRADIGFSIYAICSVITICVMLVRALGG